MVPKKAQAAVPFLNGTDGSKFIVRPMSAALIRDGTTMDLQFIKNRRLIVQEREPQLGLAMGIHHLSVKEWLMKAKNACVLS